MRNQIISKHTIVRRGESYDLQLLGKDGKPLTFFDTEKIDEELTKRFKGLYDIQMDIEEAKEAISELISLGPNAKSVVRRSLLVHAIFLYARCFAKAEGRLVKLDANKPWVLDEGDEKKRHQELIEFRNQLFAHAGEHYLYKVDSLVVVDNANKPQSIQLFPCRFELHGFGYDDLLETRNHFGKIRNRVLEKLGEIEHILGKRCYEVIVGIPWEGNTGVGIISGLKDA